MKQHVKLRSEYSQVVQRADAVKKDALSQTLAKELLDSLDLDFS